MNLHRWLTCIGVAAAVGCLTGPAGAAFNVCNRTSYILYTAVGYDSRGTVETKGWTRITPGACAKLIDGPLNMLGYYLYAQTSRAHAGLSRAWGGNVPLCVAHGAFKLRMQGTGCAPDHGFLVDFATVKTHRKTNWTETLTEDSAIPALEQARLAGLRRLLRDNGFDVTPEENDAQPFGEALAKFRARHAIAANATDDVLFAALEKAAITKVAPAGYSICNTTKAPLWAAVGLNDENSWFTRGWWKVPQSGCTTAISTPLSDERYFLFVEHANGKPIVSGPVALCVTNIAFEIQGRSNCKARGMTQAGFLETPHDGKDGYVARIGANGLLKTLNDGQTEAPK